MSPPECWLITMLPVPVGEEPEYRLSRSGAVPFDSMTAAASGVTDTPFTVVWASV